LKRRSSSRACTAAALVLWSTFAARANGDELLLAAPMVGRATASSVELNVLVGSRAIRAALWLARDLPDAPDSTARAIAFGALEPAPAPRPHLRARGVTADAASGDASLALDAGSVVELVLSGLEPGTAYRWRLDVVEGDGGERSGAALQRAAVRGRFVTVRPRGASFTFAVFSDSHVFPARLEPELPPQVEQDEGFLAYRLDGVGWYRSTREKVANECAAMLGQLARETPDFAVSLGDVFDLHGRGFNWAFDSQEVADAAHLEARKALGALADAGAIYQVLGNWEGESGCHPQAQRELAIRARERHAVNPRPDTTRFGGGVDEDYFAWEWGDALCVALNVRGYTPTAHHLGDAGNAEGRPDDFTLGAEQKAFLERTLAGSDHLWKLLFLHHVVGGNGGNPDDSAYGRGGGRAARVGEQAWVHGLCVQHGVQVVFYGHDHVFTDLAVDGVHYTLPGTTSAPWRFKTEETGYEEFWPDSGYGRVGVSSAGLRVEFVTWGGKVVHAFDVAPPTR